MQDGTIIGEYLSISAVEGMGRRPKLTPAQWEKLPDDELLQIRICDLGLELPGTVLEDRVKRLYDELDSRGIAFHPPCYLADEWLCPDKVPAIGIPFYLAHTRLVRLERRMMLEAEGDTEAWCMKLLRHEAGHALNYAYRLYRRTRWRELFGVFTQRYSSNYYAQPYSRRYVNHLEDNYAQAHPDEDFAETFAVWLTPDSRWQRRYRGWPAVRKLRYVEHVMTRLGGRPPAVSRYETPWAASRMRSTLAAYYERKRKMLGNDFPGYYDPALLRAFPPADRTAGTRVSLLMRAHRRHLVNSVSLWTHQRKFDVDKLLRKLAARADALGCRTQVSELEATVHIAALVTSIMSNVPHMDHGA
ncbi:MAG: hypothetical protein GF331_09345 [Chitinivibrionales bacterium]|nr:hypothetical protein [Chitinivibrionales bacterium]